MTKYRIVTNCSRYAIKVDGCKCIPNIVAYGMQCTFCYKHKEKLVRFKWILWDVENPTNEELENVTRHAKSLFNNKEMKKSMITDKQGREWLLQKLYDDGWKYYVKNIGDTAFVTTKRPVVNDGVLDINSGGTVKCINNISKIMPQIERNEVLNIVEELGLVDWSKVPVDTPILVWDVVGKKKLKRYFAFFENGRVHAWDGGATSWSIDNEGCENGWNYAELAEV